MSTLNVANISDDQSTLSNSANPSDSLNNTTTVDTKYVTNGCAKAWVFFDGTGIIAVDASMNVSTVNDVGVGQYTINFNNNMANAFYAYAGSAKENTTSTHGGNPDRHAQPARVPLMASNFKMFCVTGIGPEYAARDVEEASAHFMGDLA